MPPKDNRTAAHKAAARHFLETAQAAASVLSKPSLLALSMTVRAYLALEAARRQKRVTATHANPPPVPPVLPEVELPN